MSNDWNQIIKALENPKYKWRTIKGISKETGIDPEIIKKEIYNNLDLIIKSSIPSKGRDDLYTSRPHYRKKSTIFERITSSIINRAST